jgi:hypothetical protein
VERSDKGKINVAMTQPNVTSLVFSVASLMVRPSVPAKPVSMKNRNIGIKAMKPI